MIRKVTAKLSNLAKIPYVLLEKTRDEMENPEDIKKLTHAMNLSTMRGLSNKPNGMFGMRDY